MADRRIDHAATPHRADVSGKQLTLHHQLAAGALQGVHRRFLVGNQVVSHHRSIDRHAVRHQVDLARVVGGRRRPGCRQLARRRRSRPRQGMRVLGAVLGDAPGDQVHVERRDAVRDPSGRPRRHRNELVARVAVPCPGLVLAVAGDHAARKRTDAPAVIDATGGRAGRRQVVARRAVVRVDRGQAGLDPEALRGRVELVQAVGHGHGSGEHGRNAAEPVGGAFAEPNIGDARPGAGLQFLRWLVEIRANRAIRNGDQHQ